MPIRRAGGAERLADGPASRSTVWNNAAARRARAPRPRRRARAARSARARRRRLHVEEATTSGSRPRPRREPRPPTMRQKMQLVSWAHVRPGSGRASTRARQSGDIPLPKRVVDPPTIRGYRRFFYRIRAGPRVVGRVRDGTAVGTTSRPSVRPRTCRDERSWPRSTPNEPSVIRQLLSGAIAGNEHERANKKPGVRKGRRSAEDTSRRRARSTEGIHRERRSSVSAPRRRPRRSRNSCRRFRTTRTLRWSSCSTWRLSTRAAAEPPRAKTRLLVHQVPTECHIEPGTCYVIPPNVQMGSRTASCTWPPAPVTARSTRDRLLPPLARSLGGEPGIGVISPGRHRTGPRRARDQGRGRLTIAQVPRPRSTTACRAPPSPPG